MIKFSAVVAIVALVSISVLTACDRTAKSAASETSWRASLLGQGKNIQGGSVDFQLAPAPPVPTPAPLEQLEKGNASKVAAQVAAAKKVTASVATPICVGDTCYVPYANATGVRSSPPLATATPEPAWYNGFLP